MAGYVDEFRGRPVGIIEEIKVVISFFPKERLFA